MNVLMILRNILFSDELNHLLRIEEPYFEQKSNLNVKNYRFSEKAGISMISQWTTYPILNVLSVN